MTSYPLAGFRVNPEKSWNGLKPGPLNQGTDELCPQLKTLGHKLVVGLHPWDYSGLTVGLIAVVCKGCFHSNPELLVSSHLLLQPSQRLLSKDLFTLASKLSDIGKAGLFVKHICTTATDRHYDEVRLAAN